MSLKENLLKKIEIKKMAQKVIASLKPTQDGYHKIDKETMRGLLEMTSFTHRKERDLELYFRTKDTGSEKILVLDNGLSVYNTNVKDVVLRKSPTVKEIINIRNIFKILNDSDVIISKREETVEAIKNECLDSLDLSYNEKDLDQIIKDGESSLEKDYADGVIECISLFAELLDYVPAPFSIRIKHYIVYGKLEQKTGNLSVFGPMITFSRVNHELKFINIRINSADKAEILKIRNVIDGQTSADATGPEVYQFLKTEALRLKMK